MASRTVGSSGRLAGTLRDWLVDLVVLRHLLVGRLRSQLQYRASFITQIIANGLVGLSEFAVILIFFRHVDEIGGWRIGEIAILYGIATISFGIGHFVASGLPRFSEQLIRGDFDQILTRPVSAFVQVMGSDIQLRRLGTIIQGAAALAVGLTLTDVPWDLARFVVLPGIVLGIVVLYTALFALEATVSFWTTQGIEAVNIATYGGNTVAAYPIDIFAAWLKRLFLFVVPLAFAVHIPMAWLLGKPTPLGLPAWVGLLSAPVLLLFCLAIGWLWHLGVRRYRSTGS